MTNIVDAQIRPHEAAKPFPAVVAEELCLNFINTLSGRDTVAEIDCLRSGEDVVDFMVHAGLISLEQADGLHGHLRARKGAYQRLLVRALEVRETIAAIFLAISEGRKPDVADVSALDVLWKEFASQGELDLQSDGFVRVWNSDTAPVAFLLGPVVDDLFDLVASATPARMKACPADDCHFVFYDRTKNKSRVWCDMAVCGNRAKVRRFNERHRGRAAS